MYQPKWRIVQSNQGYTLLESLFSFVVFVLLSQILVMVIFWIKQMDTTFFTNEHVQWELFVQDVQPFFSNVEEVKLSNQSQALELFYKNPDETIKLNRSGDVLRQLIDNQGNIPLLIGVDHTRFDWDGNFITISVKFQNGMEKERKFFVQTNAK